MQIHPVSHHLMLDFPVAPSLVLAWLRGSLDQTRSSAAAVMSLFPRLPLQLAELLWADPIR